MIYKLQQSLGPEIISSLTVYQTVGEGLCLKVIVHQLHQCSFLISLCRPIQAYSKELHKREPHHYM